MDKLYGEEIKTFEDYLKYSERFKSILFRHIQDLLLSDISVVLDFPANTPTQRAWFRNIFESAKVEHTLHYIDVSDEICKQQLKKRSSELPKGSKFTTEAEFDMITQYFKAPMDDEKFIIKRY